VPKVRALPFRFLHGQPLLERPPGGCVIVSPALTRSAMKDCDGQIDSICRAADIGVIRGTDQWPVI
jgi:hypothetical protein